MGTVIHDAGNFRVFAHLFVAIGLNQGVSIQVVGSDTAALECPLHGIKRQPHRGFNRMTVAKAIHLSIKGLEHHQGGIHGMVGQ